MKKILVFIFFLIAVAGKSQEAGAEKNTDVKLWVIPNPSNGNFTVKSNEAGKYTMLNILGETVQVIELTSNNNYSVNMKDIESGLYFITNAGSRVRERVIVTR